MPTPKRWVEEAERVIRAEQKRNALITCLVCGITSPNGEFHTADHLEAAWDEWSPDPVFQDSEGWWFWDETWMNRFGPYDTEQIAHERCYDYARSL